MTPSQGIASLKDVEALEQHGADHPLPSSTYDMIRAGCNLDPDAPALSFFLTVADQHKPATWSYRHFLGKINQTANFFSSLDANKDTVIAYVLPNLPETHLVIWGGQATGIICAINPLLEAPAIAELLNTAGASILVTLAPFPGSDLWPKVHKAVQQCPDLRHLILVDMANHVHGVKGVIARLLSKREIFRLHGLHGLKSALPTGLRVHDFNQGIRQHFRHTLLNGRIITADDVSSYFCTGGTTGSPKLAIRHHRNEVANAWSASQFLGDGVGPGKNIFCGLPLFHVNATLVTGLVPFSRGAHVILGTPQGYRGEGVIEQFWRIVEQHHVHFFSGVPTLYTALLQIPIHKYDVSSLEYGLCGAAPLPREVFRQFQDTTGLKILEGYGLTEGTCVSSTNPPLGDRRLGSIGIRVPGQLMEAIILDDDGRYLRNASTDEVGVIAISGANVFSGYKIPEQNRDLWIERNDGRRWLNTGDLGRQDADGYFWLTGRKKELIIRGGHNIDPSTIEEPMHQHPAVRAAAAVGRPDPYAGELPVVYVELVADWIVDEKELEDFARDAIPERAAWPKHIRIIDTLPLTAVGKVFKPALKHREIKDAMMSALHDAGVIVEHLSVREEKTRGVVIDIIPARSGDESAIRESLGQFAFTLEILTLERASTS